MIEEKVYTIKTDERTVFTVLEHQLFKKRWIDYFGSVEAVLLFIENYK